MSAPAVPAPDPALPDGLEAPLPLAPRVRLLPFPVDALPPVVAGMVTAVAEATQTDPAMASTTALTVVAAAVCGRAEIEARDGWTEQLSLFTATVARPGERKSAVQDALARPLREAESLLAEETIDERRRCLVKARIDTAAADKAEADAVKGKVSVEEAIDARKIADDAEAAVPPLPRLFADDATQEALTSLMAEQRGRMAVISAEGGIFELLAGRYSSIPSMDVYLKGHAGDSLRIDRKGRPPEFIDSAALTIGVMIQPAVLATIGEHRQFRGKGLLARFLYCRPGSLVGRRKADPEPVPLSVREAYHGTIRSLAVDLANRDERLVLTLDSDAHQLIIQTLEWVEPQLADEGELASLADWGSKLVGAILRISALIHLVEHGTGGAVSAQTVGRANQIADYYRTQAIAAFAEMHIDPDTADAIYLLDRIRTHDSDVISEREILRLAQRFHNRDELNAPLLRLVDYGWLIPIESEPSGRRGRPSSPKYRIHPETVETPSHDN